jgi:hypothetical protein
LEIFFQNQTYNWIFVIVIFIRSWLTVAYSVRIMYLRLWQTSNVSFTPIFRTLELKLINKSVFYSSLGSVFAGRILSWLFFFESKSFIPILSSTEIYFICLFIVFGILTFIFFSNIKPIKSLFFMFYLTPIFQGTVEPVFNFSKKVYHFSDQAWLENFTYSEIFYNTSKSSVILRQVIKNKPLIKQITALIILLLLAKCF